MKQSLLFTKTSKTVSSDEVSLNAQFLIRGGFVDRLSAGVYTLLPLGLRVYKKVEQIIRDEMNKIGGQEVFMPSLCPLENYKKTGRYETLADDILFSAESKHVKSNVLNQSHEEVVSPLLKKFVNSYQDLPRYVYQIQNKFRGEARPKSGILRGREFIMKDLYSFHADQQDLDSYYEKVKDSYINIFSRAGIGDETYLTYASGGTFSKYSHEFQALTDAGEDHIYICDKCRVAINREILEDQEHKCPECGNNDLREEKAVEVGNIFKLKTKFSDPFDLSYLDRDNKKHPVVMGCYGIGLQRLVGTIVEIKHDDRGIIWPETVAPFYVHLVSLKQNEMAEKIYQDLQENNIEVLYDDRDVSFGAKFADSDLIGCPYRIVVSEKTLKEDSIELKKRDEENSKLIKLNDILSIFK